MTVAEEIIDRLSSPDAKTAHDTALALGRFLAQGRPPSPSAPSKVDEATTMRFLTPTEPAWPRGRTKTPEQREFDDVVAGLVRYLAAAPTRAHPMTVWALGQAQSPRGEPALRGVLEENLDTEDEDRQHLAVQAISALTLLPNPPDDLLRAAAERGHGMVHEVAQNYVECVLNGAA